MTGCKVKGCGDPNARYIAAARNFDPSAAPNSTIPVCAAHHAEDHQIAGISNRYRRNPTP